MSAILWNCYLQKCYTCSTGHSDYRAVKSVLETYVFFFYVKPAKKTRELSFKSKQKNLKHRMDKPHIIVTCGDQKLVLGSLDNINFNNFFLHVQMSQ